MVQPDRGCPGSREAKDGSPNRLVSDVVLLEPERVDKKKDNRESGQDWHHSVECPEEALLGLDTVPVR